MSLDADTIVDRRRLRRKLTFWRVVAARSGRRLSIGGALCCSRIAARDLCRGPATSSRAIKIQGVIRGDTERVEALERLGKSNARAVIVHVDSPGGTTAGSEQLA